MRQVAWRYTFVEGFRRGRDLREMQKELIEARQRSQTVELEIV
jgi:hypothetical protein